MLTFFRKINTASVDSSLNLRRFFNSQPFITKLYADLNNPQSPIRKPSKAVELPLNAEDLRLCDELRIKYATEDNCVGFAAPQFGINKRIIVVGIPQSVANEINEEPFPNTVLINPEITPLPIYGTGSDWETCFSDCYFTGFVERFNVVRYAALNEQGLKLSGIARGLLARVLQHEVDHLNGVMFKDRAKRYVPIREVFNLDEIPTQTPYAAKDELVLIPSMGNKKR